MDRGYLMVLQGATGTITPRTGHKIVYYGGSVRSGTGNTIIEGNPVCGGAAVDIDFYTFTGTHYLGPDGIGPFNSLVVTLGAGPAIMTLYYKEV